MSDTIWLQRPGADVPWGFRISGGRDYQEQVKVSRLTAGSIASTGLTLGDVLLRIGDANTSSLTQAQANELIKNSGNLLQLCVSKGATSQNSAVSHTGGAQVANPTHTSSAVHDLFQDMYRNTPPAHGASLPDNRPQQIPVVVSGGGGLLNSQQNNIKEGLKPKATSPPAPSFGTLVQNNNNTKTTTSPNSTSGENQHPLLHHPPSSTVSKNAYNNIYNKGSNVPSNNEDIYSEYNQASQQGMVYRNYKPSDASLNSSTDSGVYLDAQQNLLPSRQNSNLSSSQSGSSYNPEALLSLLSSCNSEVSDTTDTDAYTITPSLASHEKDEVVERLSPSPPPLPSQPPPELIYFRGSPSSSPPSGMESPSSLPSPLFSPPLPPPPPPLPVDSMTEEIHNTTIKTTRLRNSGQENPTNSEGNSDEYPTRLNQQLGSMNIDNYNRQSSDNYNRQSSDNYNRQSSQPGSQPAPTSPYSSQPTTLYGSSQPTTPYSPYSPPKMRGYQSPSTAAGPSPQSYHSPTNPPGAPGYHPLANVPPPPPPPPPPPAHTYSQQQQQHSPYGNHYDSPTGAPEVIKGCKVPPKVADKPVPDAVINMAARGEKDKKPFAYAADMDEIKQHRERVRRKPAGIPSYQNILNLPQFEEPKARPYNPNAPNAKTPSTPPALPQGPGEGVFAHSQYNSPLGMYSSNAAEEAFVAQSSGLVTGVAGQEQDIPQIRLPGTKETKDITQSETYKMIHGLDHAKPKAKVVMPAHPSHGRVPRQPAPDDEMTFTGVNHPESIPSKSFHRLQSMTDQEPEIDTTSIRPKNLAVDDESVSGYDEASIRYMGKNIPSKSFRMLQNMTGGPDTGQAMPKRRPVRKPEPQSEPETNTDDIVDISYVGGNIPSRSFKMLQQSVGQPNGSDDTVTSRHDVIPPAQTAQSYHPVQPVVTAPVAGPTDNRRQRRRQRNKEIQQQDSREEEAPREFDENAYLSGQIKVVSDSVNNPPRRPMTQMSIDLSCSQPEREDEPQQLRNFDEQAFLSGRVAIFGEEPKPWSPKRKEFREKASWEKDAEELESRRAKLFEEEPFKRKGKAARDRAPWEQDGAHYGRPELADIYHSKDPIERERAPWEKDDPDRGRPELAELYNNRGNINREPAPWEKEEDTGRVDLAELYKPKEVAKEAVPWERRKSEGPIENNFDENIFLRRTSTDVPPPIADCTEINGRAFSEDDFLQGRIPLVSGDTEGTTALHSSAQYKKPSAFRDRAPWEKPEEGEGGGFDEKEFLMGRVPVVGSKDKRQQGSFSKIPSKAFQRLTRSMSREASPSLDTTSDYLSSDDVDDYQSDSGSHRGGDMRYKGNYFPSKTFHKLRRSMDRRRSAEPNQDYNAGQYNAEDDYVSDAVEDVTIENKEPEAYLENLKQSMQGQHVRIEPQAEATDF